MSTNLSAANITPGSSTHFAPLWLRVWRIIRLTAKVLQGFATMLLFFPFWGKHRRTVAQQRWSREGLLALGVKVDAPTTIITPGSLLVSNHISWADILVLSACYPLYFVAKDEVSTWPLIGSMVKWSGAIFIERKVASKTRFASAAITKRMEQGDNVMLFPEGTTTDGKEVLPFFSPLFQPAIHTGRNIYPISLDYLQADGSISDAAAYPIGVSLLQSVWRLASQPGTIAKVQVSEALPTSEPGESLSRKALAQKARATIIKNRCFQPSGIASQPSLTQNSGAKHSD